MSLLIKNLKIEVLTPDGIYGVDIPFESGLCILRLNNTHGKSTCVNAIAYALGMERGLGNTSVGKPPFPHVMTDFLTTRDGKEVTVISSKVILKISNGTDIAEICRDVVGGSTTRAKVNIFSQEKVQTRELFLHKEGDTTRDNGFYFWLSEFLSWQLPLVPTFEGVDRPLYPAIFFPSWFIEQKRGWSSVLATTPTNLGIRQPKQRALEFILDLDTNNRIRELAEVQNRLSSIQSEWKSTLREGELHAAENGFVLSGVPEKPTKQLDLCKVIFQSKLEDKWVPVEDFISALENELVMHNLLYPSRIQRNSRDDEEYSRYSAEVNNLREQVRQLTKDFEQFSDQLFYLDRQIDLVNKRLESLSEDERKYQDLKKIESKSTLALGVDDNGCPICGNTISDNLLDLVGEQDLFDLNESLEFIRSQKKTLNNLLDSYRREIERKAIEEEQTANLLSEKSVELKKLIERSSEPNPEYDERAIIHRLNLENRIEKSKKSLKLIEDVRLRLDSLNREFNNYFERRKKLNKSTLSSSDRKKLKALQREFVELLEEYGFSSFPPETLQISDETYLPVREGYDVAFDVSASDGIRIIWSYVLAMLKIGSIYKTNHPRLVIFDEPKQQDTDKLSFASLLKLVSKYASENGQVIVATSEDEGSITRILEGTQYSIQSYPPEFGKIFQKLKSA